MWWSKKPEPPKDGSPTPYFGTTSLQVGDECVCLADHEHGGTHQTLLLKGQIYKVRDVTLITSKQRMAINGYSGPWIRLEGVFPAHDLSWGPKRFEKVTKLIKKSDILAQVMEPAGLDVEKERKLAKADLK